MIHIWVVCMGTAVCVRALSDDLIRFMRRIKVRPRALLTLM